MGKLYSSEDFAEGEEQVSTIAPQDVFANMTDDVVEYANDLNIATERLTIASNELNLVGTISTAMRSKKLASVDYFTSLENYKPVLESIAQNLGVKCHVPSLEDFKNPNGTQASHEVAMEGFFDYIKKVWDKIKDIFMSFFKKINVFFRRLFNAELELSTYEEYLEGMIAKIKAKKMTISDSKTVLDSKLPTLLANPGMESIDSDFILTVGESKVRQLISVSNHTFQNTLTKIAKEELKELYKVLKELISDASDNSRPLDDVAKDLDKVRALCTEGLDQLFGYEVHDLRQLPDQVYDAIYHNFDKSEIEEVKINSLVDNNNFSESLPKNFNAYYVLSESGKLYVSATTETSGYVQNKLFPISNANNLVRFYDFYKKVSKELNMKRIDASIGEFQDRVDDIVDLMKSKYVELLEKLQKTKHTARQGLRMETKQDGIKELVRFFRYLDVKLNSSTTINDLLWNSFDGMIDAGSLENIIRDDDVEASYYKLMDSITDEEAFLKKARSVILSDTNGFSESATDIEEIERIVKEYENFQKFLLNYLNGLQVMLKEVSVNLAGTYTEVRFELAKYIYNSARLYVS